MSCNRWQKTGAPLPVVSRGSALCSIPTFDHSIRVIFSRDLGLAIVLVNRLLLSVSSECKSFFSVVVTLGLTTVGEHHLSNVSRESIDVSRDMRATEGRLVSF